MKWNWLEQHWLREMWLGKRKDKSAEDQDIHSPADFSGSCLKILSCFKKRLVSCFFCSGLCSSILKCFQSHECFMEGGRTNPRNYWNQGVSYERVISFHQLPEESILKWIVRVTDSGVMTLVLNASEWKDILGLMHDPQLTMEQSQMAVCDPDTQREFWREQPDWWTA